MSTTFDATTISAFSASIEGDVITRDHPEYLTAIGRWAKNAERKALFVVFVKTTEDVVKSIAFAKAHAIPLAIRGGGHNAAGSSSIEDGLVIDLSKYINTVRVDEEKKLVYVGGGSLWGQVDQETIKYGLATVAGTVSHTGVAGLTVGGGYGWLSGRHGLTIDNLRQVTVVVADGSVVTANDNENEDLFWAVRGGGSNFGVITEFVFQVHPQRKTVFAGFVGFTADKLEALLKASKAWSDAGLNENEGMHFIITRGPQGVAAMPLIFYNGSEEEGRANYKWLYDIGPIIDGARELPFEKLNTIMDPQADHGNCYYLSGFAHTGGLEFSTAEQLLSNINALSAEGTFNPIVIFEFIHLAKSNSVPVSATAFRRNLSFNGLSSTKWSGEQPEKTGEARAIARKLIGIVMSQKEGVSAQLAYTNYDHDADTTIVTDKAGHAPSPHNLSRSAIAFGSNYPRLQVVKKKYDPENIFNRWYPITPAA